MSDDRTPDDYEVGYGKPPKATRFQKGVSGNPKGRPKAPPDFDAELIREARSLITINENGRPRRISKHSAVMKQLLNFAIKGNTSGLRAYLKVSRPAFERNALLEAQREKDSESRKDIRQMPLDELERLLAQQLDKEKKRKK